MLCAIFMSKPHNLRYVLKACFINLCWLLNILVEI